MKKYFLISFLAIGFTLQAQVSIGFKAGLNFSNMDGELEMDAQGNALETIKSSTGFNVGALVNYSITDFFGLRTEFIYAQKGRVINYNGDSYFVFDATNNSIVATGNRNLELDVINSYLEIPLLAYAKFGKIEIMGGAYVSTLIGSVADGSLTFTPDSRQGNNFDLYEFTLDFRYRRDEAGEGTGEVIPLSVNGVDVPNTLGAYYEYSSVDNSLHNLLDVGVIGGLSFYLNDGFFINARIEYGLTDTTDDRVDVSYSTVPVSNNQFSFRGDNDRNFTLHTSVAFRF